MRRRPRVVRRRGDRCFLCLVPFPVGEEVVQVDGYQESYHAACLDAEEARKPPPCLTLEAYLRLAAEDREPRTVARIPVREKR